MKHLLALLEYDREPLSAVLSRVPPEARDVVLCGPLPGESLRDLVAWIYDPRVVSEWDVSGTYLGQEEDKAPTVALTRGERAIRLRWLSAWLEAPLGALAGQAVFAQVDEMLSHAYRNRSLNFASPVALGRHLMSTAWMADGISTDDLRAVPEDVRAILTEHSPQGRHECLTLPDLETIPALYQYDMRLAYLWCCKGLPYGQMVELISGPDTHKALVEWQSPDRWDHIGLLPQRQQGWVYPPGGYGWIDRREYDQAERNGWTLDSKKGCDDTQAYQWMKEGALDGWSDRIQSALRQTDEGSPEYRLLRRVALNTIGSLHRSSVKRYRAAPRERKDLVPAGNPSLRLAEDYWYWYEEQPISSRGLIYVHPEWTTTIWARCRARVAQAALQFPREQVIAIRQDALFTSQKHPTWKGAAGVGRFRLKDTIEGPLPAPHSIAEFDALRQQYGD